MTRNEALDSFYATLTLCFVWLGWCGQCL